MDDKHRIEPDESLDALLDRVERGEEIVIARDGKPVARLVPATPMIDRARAQEALKRLEELRKRATLGDLKIEELIHEGHKY
ncbi:MAG: type II toxin-antitoxin system Phd/YefM family antitoxin [Devosia sp.]